jgi:CheY-like chemotaxis protein/anti-sigma regulatory factor (Ser/Thr protein kinase)
MSEQSSSLVRPDFLATVSHEMRNSLNGLLGVTELLLTSDLDDEQRRQVDTIRACADGLCNLSIDMLDLSRMEAGQFRMVEAPFSPVELLEHVGRVMGPQAADRCLRFEARFGERARRTLLGDRARICQILLNLIGNAVKFTREGMISVHMSAEERGERVCLRFVVSDTGCGMDPAMTAALFQPWRRPRQHAESGAGLGLAISRQLARQMDGDITVRSQPGIGSTFIVELALPEAEPEADDDQDDRQTADAPLAAMRVLVADDHLINRALLEAVMRKLGHDVITVDNGRSAVDRAQSGGIDLVLMDIQMPQLDGVAATREIRASETDGRRIPILGVTGHDSPEHRRAFRAAGMDGVVMKPYDVSLLVAEIARVVSAPSAPSTPPDTCATAAEGGWDPASPLAETLQMIRALEKSAVTAGH